MLSQHTRGLLRRQLVNAPPNVVTPTALAEAAAETAAAFPERLSLTVLEKADCEKLGMGSYLGVAEASAEPPKFIHLVYKPAGGATKKARERRRVRHAQQPPRAPPTSRPVRSGRVRGGIGERCLVP